MEVERALFFDPGRRILLRDISQAGDVAHLSASHWPAARPASSVRPTLATCGERHVTRGVAACRSLEPGSELVRQVQAGIADETFDLLLMCGVLEYAPLADGLREAARVLKKGSPLVLIPVKPSVVGTVTESG